MKIAVKNKPKRIPNKRTINKIIEGLKEGDTFFDKDGYKCHVVTNLNKEDGGQIVFKYYGKRKRWWHYFIEPYCWFELRMASKDRPLKIKIK